MTPLEYYDRLRREVSHEGCVAAVNNTISVSVQLGVCSQAAGALHVLKALENVVFHHGIPNVVIHRTGCQGSCSYEPIVTLSRQGEAPVTYVRVTPEKARILLMEYALNSRIIGSWTLIGKEVTL